VFRIIDTRYPSKYVSRLFDSLFEATTYAIERNIACGEPNRYIVGAVNKEVFA